MAQLPYFETLEIAGWMAATEGMRAPLKSYSRSDSVELGPWCERQSNFIFGTKDYDLAKRLCKAGPEHRKWMRQIQVWAKFNLSLYQHQEADTYHIGVTKNSESTMHTLSKRSLNWDDFDTKYMSELGKDDLSLMIARFNKALTRYNDDLKYLETINERRNKTTDWAKSDEEALNHDIEDQKNIIEKEFIDLKSMLPSSFIQTRYVNLNYEVLRNMYHQRKNHRLPQWSIDFVSWIKSLPYSEFITDEWND